MATLEIKVISPKKLYNPARARQTIESAYREVVQGAKNDFQRTTSSWRHRVSFTVLQVGTSWYVTTGSKLYEMISETGARSHVITPQVANYLRFQRNYRAKTSPGSLTSGAGGKSGPFVRALRVRHPGFKARKFVEAVRKKWEPVLVQKVNAAIAKEA